MKILALRKTRHSLTARLSFQVMVSTAVTASGASAAAGDQHWDNVFGWPGVPEWVYALKANDQKLYVGGYAITPNATSSQLHVWDGTNWSVLGTISGDRAIAYDFEFVGNDLFVGGSFESVNGVAATGLARWNGTNWSSVGGFEGSARALRRQGTDLYVGGSFTNAGGVWAVNVARWNGMSWSALGDGLGDVPDDDTFGSLGVHALEFFDGALHAGGTFTNSGLSVLPYMARWTGTNWANVGDARDGSVNTLLTHGSSLYAGGHFTTGGSDFFGKVARWDGTNWFALGDGLSGNVSCLEILGDDLYAGGLFSMAGNLAARNIAKWNGSAWSALGELNDEANQMQVIGTNLYVAGRFATASNFIMGQVARYDGANWHSLSDRPNQGISTYVQSVFANGTNVYVSGFFGSAGSIQTSRVARWDGTGWFPLGSGMQGPAGTSNAVRAITVRGEEIFAGGAFTNAGGVSASNIARWNGSGWEAMNAGVAGTVFSISVSATDVYAGGKFTNAGGLSISNIARWNSSGWSAMGGGLSGGTVAAVLADDGEVYAGGAFTSADGAPANRVAKWNGSAWSSIGTGLENGVSAGWVYALAVHGSNLYVGGSFTSAGSIAASRIAMWNGIAWSALGGGVSGGVRHVRGLAWSNGKLYASGSFTNISGVNASSIACWDGTNWFALGRGLEHHTGMPRGYSIAASGQDVFLGGIFSAGGGKPSYFIARWNETMNFDPRLTLSEFARTGSDFQLRVTANAVTNYVVEGTHDFSTWTPFATNSAPSFLFQHSNPAALWQFYRARGQ